jgi:hypothetical protein
LVSAHTRLPGGSIWVALTTSLRTTRRNQMLEVRFDPDQVCFLGQPAGNEFTITFAPQGLTKADLMGEPSQMSRSLPEILRKRTREMRLPLALHHRNPNALAETAAHRG